MRYFHSRCAEKHSLVVYAQSPGAARSISDLFREAVLQRAAHGNPGLGATRSA